MTKISDAIKARLTQIDGLSLTLMLFLAFELRVDNPSSTLINYSKVIYVDYKGRYS